MSDDFVADYNRAMACYTDDDFAQFFQISGIEDPKMKAVGRDFLGVSGAFYFSQMDRQAATPSRGETLKHLARAKRASRDLADSLGLALSDPSVFRELANAGTIAGRELKSDGATHADSSKIFSAIFPVEADGSGFRYDGLHNTLLALAHCLQQIEEERVEKSGIGRGKALHPWLILMNIYLSEANGVPPTVGHYHKEIGDYDSSALAALSHAIHKLDSEVSSRLLAKGLPPAQAALIDNPMEPQILLLTGFGELISAGALSTEAETLAIWLKMPVGKMDEVWGSIEPRAKKTREKAQISKEEFFETLKSSEEGKMLLQAFVATRDT